MSHQAAFIPEKHQQLSISSTPTPKVTANTLLIRNQAVAINPVDYVIQTAGIFLKDYPAILGSDVAGEVIEVGESVTSVKKGDRVIGATVYLTEFSKEYAGFQEIVLLPEVAVCKIPDSMLLTDAVALPLSVATAAAGLYGKRHLNLPFPSTNPQPSGKKLLIWGGSSSVGSSVVQLAIASGLEVVVTASPKNFDYVRGLVKGGNVKLFDHNSPSIVGDLTAELESGCVGAYDAITKRDTQLAIATILAQLGGGTIASTLEPPTDELPATVNSVMVYAPLIFGPEYDIGKAVFGDFLAKALASGEFVPAPKSEVVGKGLDKIQGAMDTLKAGVSAKKIVVEL